MALLLAVSLIWAFSFGIVKRYLSGLDPTAVAAMRLLVSLAVFAPLFRFPRIGARRSAVLALIGAVQFGAVYVLYLRSYRYLHAYEVALFTITTPIFVMLLDAAAVRRWRLSYLAAALLSVAGAALVEWTSALAPGVVRGFVLMQLSNACFAAGQVAWRAQRGKIPAEVSDASVFAAAYAGALALTLAVSAFTTRWAAFSPNRDQWAAILFLGALASGLGFFLWNVGATRVNAGTLAAFNNAKIPLGIAVSLLVFGERADIARLVAGGAVMAAGVWIAGKGAGQNDRPQVRRA